MQQLDICNKMLLSTAQMTIDMLLFCLILYCLIIIDVLSVETPSDSKTQSQQTEIFSSIYFE